MAGDISVPTKSSLMEAGKGYLQGGVVGLAYQAISQLFGSTLLGSIGAAVAAGSFLKGEGKTLCMILGFQAITSGGINLGLGNLFGSGSSSSDDEGEI